MVEVAHTMLTTTGVFQPVVTNRLLDVTHFCGYHILDGHKFVSLLDKLSFLRKKRKCLKFQNSLDKTLLLRSQLPEECLALFDQMFQEVKEFYVLGCF